MKKTVLPFILYFVLLVIMTFPLCMRINGYIPGFFSSDEPYTVIWDAWRIKFSLLHHIPLRISTLVSYPFGLNLYGEYYSYIWEKLFYFLSFVTTAVLAYNIQIVFNFLLSAMFTYA